MLLELGVGHGGHSIVLKVVIIIFQLRKLVLLVLSPKSKLYFACNETQRHLPLNRSHFLVDLPQNRGIKKRIILCKTPATPSNF